MAMDSTSCELANASASRKSRIRAIRRGNARFRSRRSPTNPKPERPAMGADWRAWLPRWLSRVVPQTPEQARQERAATIAALWAEVGQLQQAIKAASDALDRLRPGEARQRQAQHLAAQIG